MKAVKFPKRKSTHMASFDYGENYRYFVTICTQNRKALFSVIRVGEGLAPPAVELLKYGRIAEEQLLLLQERYPSLYIENYVIMPNHIHMLVRLESTGGASPSPTLHDLVCTFKSLTTRCCRQIGFSGSLWQRSYYDHIIRDEHDYQNIWRYIDNNPARWEEDEYFSLEP